MNKVICRTKSDQGTLQGAHLLDLGLPKDKGIASPGAWSSPTQPEELNYKLAKC